MGRCPIINIKEILDNTFIRVQTGCHNVVATIESDPRCAGNLIPLSFYGRHKGISTSELEQCVNHWVRLAWSLPSEPVDNNTMQITWHRLAIFKTSDVQFMSVQFSLYLSMSMSRPLEPSPNPQTRAQERPKCPSDTKTCQNQACIIQPRLLADRRNARVSKRRSSLRTCPLRPRTSQSTNHNTGQQVIMSDTTSQTSGSQDSDENRQASIDNTATSSISAGYDPDRHHACEIAPMHLDELPNLSDPGDEKVWEAGVRTDIWDQRGSYPFLNSISEYQANLDAVSPEFQDLFLQATAHAKEETYLAEDDSIDTYWSWCKEKQQWYHEDTDCNTVVWFPKDFD